jgi:hypothetical protein
MKMMQGALALACCVGEGQQQIDEDTRQRGFSQWFAGKINRTARLLDYKGDWSGVLACSQSRKA